MLRNKLYYRLKPLIPWPMRVAARRLLALRQRARFQGIWPVLPGSEQPPTNWPGGPDGKKFALVLTHDVEGQVGLDKCEHLMDLEMSLGLRSSFTFIPQGGYRVSRALRSDMVENGFEIAVHDLHPDGVGTSFPFWVPRPNGSHPDASSGVQGSGFNVQGSKFGVQGSGVQSSGLGPSPSIHQSTN